MIFSQRHPATFLKVVFSISCLSSLSQGLRICFTLKSQISIDKKQVCPPEMLVGQYDACLSGQNR